LLGQFIVWLFASRERKILVPALRSSSVPWFQLAAAWTRLRAPAPAPRQAFPRNVKRNRFGISVGKNTANEEGRMKNAEGKMEDGATAEVGQYQPVTRCDPQ